MLENLSRLMTDQASVMKSFGRELQKEKQTYFKLMRICSFCTAMPISCWVWVLSARSYWLPGRRRVVNDWEGTSCQSSTHTTRVPRVQRSGIFHSHQNKHMLQGNAQKLHHFLYFKKHITLSLYKKSSLKQLDNWEYGKEMKRKLTFCCIILIL